MKAVILAAGKGTRMRELTMELPKPMLSVLGKTLLEHKFDALPLEVEEIILIVGYQGDKIRAAFGERYNGTPLRYIEQADLNGTMGALALAAPHLSGRFLVMMGDDIYGAEDIKAMMAHEEWSVLIERTESMASGGKVVYDDRGVMHAIEEGDHRGKPGAMNTNLFLLDSSIFDFPQVPKAAGSDEMGLPQTALAASLMSGIRIQTVPATFWIQVTAPEDLIRAEAILSTVPTPTVEVKG